MKRILMILAVLMTARSSSADDAKFRRSQRPAKGHSIVMLEPPGAGIDVGYRGSGVG